MGPDSDYEHESEIVDKNSRISTVRSEENAIKNAVTSSQSNNSIRAHSRNETKTPTTNQGEESRPGSTSPASDTAEKLNGNSNINNRNVPQKSSESPRKTISTLSTISATNSSAKDNTTEVAVNNQNKPKVSLPYYLEPTFYIGGGNGAAIIEEIMLGLGWKRTRDKDDNYKLRWCELKSQINYHTFKEGEQLANHIPNCNLLTNKLGLVNSLQEYDRMATVYRRRIPKLDFIPETFKLDDPREREAFRQSYQEGDMFICKPTGRNQGKGIFLVKTQQEVNKVFEDQEGRTKDGKPIKPLNRIIQRYLHKPLLLNKKKFDLRCYMLVASTIPFLVVFHKGYVRLSIHDYDIDSDNLIAHLTNQFIQKKDPTYKDVKDETTWSMEKFNQYVNENFAAEKGLEQDWVFGPMTTRMKQIMTYCFNAVKHKLACKIGYFDLYGFDFMVDEDMKVWLIEVNVNPCLAINCEALKEVIPGCVKETIHLAIECFEKSRKGKPLLPLQSLENFEILVNACPRSGTKDSKGQAIRSKSTSPAIVKRSYTRSPLKEPAVVSTSNDVARSEYPKFVPRTGANNTYATRRLISNTTTVTSTENIDSSDSKASSGDSVGKSNSIKQTRATKSSGSLTRKDENEAENESTTAKTSNSSRNNNSNSAIKVTTFSLPEESSSAKQQQQNKPVPKQPVSSDTRIFNKNFLKQNTESSQLRAKPNPTKKMPYKNLKREPTISVKVITKEQNLLPAETKIVIVDNKTNTEISADTPSSGNDKSSLVDARRSVYINSSAPKHKKHYSSHSKSDSPENSSDDQPTKKVYRSKSSASKIPPENRHSESGRKSAVGRKFDNMSPPMAFTYDNSIVDSRNNLRHSIHTLHGGNNITGVGMLPVTGITPTDPAEDTKAASRYATVFPISPYTEPVAQLRMTHRPIKKSKSRLSYENRGS